MTNILFYSILSIVVFAGDARPSCNGRIVGGENATIEEFPYQISVEVDRDHYCGGSILNSTVILTAAHCVYLNFDKSIRIRAGSIIRGKGGLLRNVETIIIHDHWNATTLDYDAALLVLEKPLQFSSAISPITLPHENEYLDAPEIGVTTGWGYDWNGEFIAPDLLQKVYLEVMTQKQCNESYSSNIITLVTPRMICAGLRIGGFCAGDSGGPLASKNKLHGIVSWSNGCGTDVQPDVFTRVTAIRQWIREKVLL